MTKDQAVKACNPIGANRDYEDLHLHIREPFSTKTGPIGISVIHYINSSD